tara:strand:+ start:1 stop:1236 length:1236 start_codon:yes stop_codon:yes gene_type:complete
MKKIKKVLYDPQVNMRCEKEILENLSNGEIIQMLPSAINQYLWPTVLPYKKSSVIFSSAGTSNKPIQCLHCIDNLNISALDTGNWLKENEIEPKDCYILNSLPLNHISGFMAFWRSIVWKCSYKFICPQDMKNGEYLCNYFMPGINFKSKFFVISLVPTQLIRLMDTSSGIKWLKTFNVVWIGGSPIPTTILSEARRAKINLAPCYGSTETAAMISCTSPKEFLAGHNDLGKPMGNIKLKISSSNKNLQILTKRLALEVINKNKIQTITNHNGWWESGDIGKIYNFKDSIRLNILGRIDNSFKSGGETIYPEELQSKLEQFISTNKIPIKNIIVIGIEDKTWCKKVNVIFSLEPESLNIEIENIVKSLKVLTNEWEKHKIPKAWIWDQRLSKNLLGKYEIEKWEKYIIDKY